MSRRSICRHKTNIGQSTSIYSCCDRGLENLIILLCAKNNNSLATRSNFIYWWKYDLCMKHRTWDMYTQFLLQKRYIPTYISSITCIIFFIRTIFYISHYKHEFFKSSQNLNTTHCYQNKIIRTSLSFCYKEDSQTLSKFFCRRKYELKWWKYLKKKK